MTEPAGTEITYRTELVRKAIHLCSLVIPLIYYFVTRQMALTILLPVTIFFVVVDIGRYYIAPLERWFLSFFGWLMRRKEVDSSRKRLNGATHVLISATLCVFLFPKPIAISAFSVLIIGDLMAALIGRRWGKRRFFQKSFEGSMAFFLSGFLLLTLIPTQAHDSRGLLIAFIASAVGSIVEALPWEVDDNLSIPLAVGGVLWVGATYFPVA